MDSAFGRSSDFSVGIEEELLLVQGEGHALSHTSAEVLSAMGMDERSARHDLYAAQIELSSPPSTKVEDAMRSLDSLRARVWSAGATAIGVGVHPAARFGDVRIVDAERYRAAERSLGGIVQRTPDSALHVHVGVPDAGTAIRVCNGLREHLPLFEALAANSPFWHGVDSGHASARRVLRRSFPRVGAPPAFRDFSDYEQQVEQWVEAAALPDYTFVWWEVRPHPRFGTVEVRAMDSQSSVTTVAGIAALVQSLARQLAEADSPGVTGPELLEESSFRAGRDGVRAHLWDANQETWSPFARLLASTLERVRPHARELGADGALDQLEHVSLDGGGADRQRLAHRSGAMPAVLSGLVEETGATGSRSFRPSASRAPS